MAYRDQRITGLVPVYNEEITLPKFMDDLSGVMKKGIINKTVIVNDGSTDSSGSIIYPFLERPEFVYIKLDDNIGKAYAFYAGAKRAYEMGTDVIVTLDADLLNLDHKKVKIMLEPLNNPVIDMVNGTTEGDNSTFTGERAIRMTALLNLVDEKRKCPVWLELIAGIAENGPERVGYGLERALNCLIDSQRTLISYFSYADLTVAESKNITFADTFFRCGPVSTHRQDGSRERAKLVIEEPLLIVKKIKNLAERGVFPASVTRYRDFISQDYS